MWLVSLLPEWIFSLIIVVGLLALAATYLLKFIPFFTTYRTPIQIGSVIAIVVGTYYSGATANEQKWQARVSELEVQLAQAQAESEKENVKIVEKVVTKTQVVKQRGSDIVQYVDREVVKYDSKCIIPKEFIEAHNRAAESVK